MKENRRFVVTGGPGSGKTTLCEALGRRGLTLVAESGRAVIREQIDKGGTALPWTDPQAFAAEITARDVRQYRATEGKDSATIFDRGFPDTMGYLTMLGLPVPVELDRLCSDRRYANPVFVAPPWQDIYVQDAERKQDWDEALLTFDAMVSAYLHYGYKLAVLPAAPVSERVDFVLAILNR